MKKLLSTVILTLLYCSLAFGESALPKCKGNDHSKWVNCYGEFTAKYDDKLKYTYKGEFGIIPGKWEGLGMYFFFDSSGKELAKYVGQVSNGREFGFGIFTESNGFKSITQKDKNGIGFTKRYYPEGDFYIGQTKRGKRHGYGLQTFFGKKNSGVYASFNDGLLKDNIPLDEIQKFEEDILVFEAKLKSMEECDSYGIQINSQKFKQCSKKYLEFYIKELNQKRVDRISKFKLRKMSNTQLLKDEEGELKECVSYTLDGYCAHTIPYEIKSKKYTNNKYNAQKLIELGLILTSNNQNYSNSEPRLFYDKATGRMLECNGRVTIGKCFNYNYNTNSYTSNTLFYNPKTGAMQECAMQNMGKCNSFRSMVKIPGRDQLFYDKRSNSMKTCMSNTIKGKCVRFGMAPSHRTKNKKTGSYIVDSAANPYYKKVPKTNTQLINLGLNMLSGGCTLGLNC